jgi:RNA polymerase sigma-70 factor (ECF subfamily)
MNLQSNLSTKTQSRLSTTRTIDETAVNSPVPSPKDGQAVALEEIWKTHSRQILRITEKITNNREDAEDALQESFLRAHVHLHNFDGRSSIKTWLTRIAINSALMIVRKRANAPRLLSIDDSADSGAQSPALDPVDQAASPEAQVAKLEQQQIVRQAIGSLRPSLRQALALQTAEERTTAEIAERMSLSISATKARIFQAKASLRKSLKGGVRGLAVRTQQLQLSTT